MVPDKVTPALVEETKSAFLSLGEISYGVQQAEEKSKFFTYIEDNWTDEDPATDDNDVVDEECGGKKKKMTQEEQFRRLIRKEIANAMR